MPNKSFELFGWSISRTKPMETPSPVTPPVTGASVVTAPIAAYGYYGYSYDLDGLISNQNQLVNRYREISTYPDCDTAIEQIVNEAVIVDQAKPPVTLNVDQAKLSKGMKKKILDEFDTIIRLTNFNENCHDIFKRWYIDGRSYFYVAIDEKHPTKGILDVKYIDNLKIREVQKITKENRDGIEVVTNVERYYLFNDNGLQNSTSCFKLSPDTVVDVKSGLVDANSGEVISFLFKAIKPVNQLRMMEDAMVIYRISRAPERRIFYVDVANLQPSRAEQYVQDVMNKFRNKIVYDPITGEVKNNRNYLSMCLAMDTKVPLLDGRTLTIEEISNELVDNPSNKLWAYSCDPQTGAFAPGLITNAGVTRRDQKVMRITFDNGKSITCTPDHKFPVREGGFVEAQDLVVGQSMMPWDTRESKLGEGDKNCDLQLFQNDKESWESVHRIVSDWKDNVGVKEDIYRVVRQFSEYRTYVELKDAHAHHNHKVAKIEYLDETMDVGCLTIDGDERYHGYHTFAVEAGVYVKNCEDYFLPRREGGRATEIQTLPAGQALSNEDTEWFQRKLYQSMNVPIQRLMPENGFSLGRSNEITREEILFSKFIQRLRNNFNSFFFQLLKIQLISKRIIREEEWEELRSQLFVEYQHDNYFEELKRSEIFRDRMELAQQADGYKGVYFSKDYIAKNILQFTEQEWDRMKQEMKAEADEEAGNDFGDNGDDGDDEDNRPSGSPNQTNDTNKSADEPDDEPDDTEEEVDVLTELEDQHEKI